MTAVTAANPDGHEARRAVLELLQAEARQRDHLCTCAGRKVRTMIEWSDMTQEQRTAFHLELAAARAAACKVHPDRGRIIHVRFVHPGDAAASEGAP